MAEALLYVYPPNATAGQPRICLCGKKINLARRRRRCKCCKWNFCTGACRTEFAAQHKGHCDSRVQFNAFMDINFDLFKPLGFWLKTRPDKEYVGLYIELDDDITKEVKAIALDDQSLRNLVGGALVKCSLRNMGYVDCIVLAIKWKGKTDLFEVDFVEKIAAAKETQFDRGVIRVARSPLFDLKALHKVITPIGEAMNGKGRNDWSDASKGGEKDVRLVEWSDVASWKKMVRDASKVVKKVSKMKIEEID
jgi:hypothetical protein